MDIDGLQHILGHSYSFTEIRFIRQDQHGVVTKFYPAMGNLFGLVSKDYDTLPIGRWNVYMGRNPRETQDGSALGIDYATAVSIDIDPIKAIKESPASPSEQKEAWLATDELDETVRAASVFISTGNGYQLVYPFETPVDVRGRRKWFEKIVQSWEKHVIGNIEARHKVRIDPQYDLPRIIKCPDFVSYKGKPILSEGREWRTTKADWCGDQPRLDFEEMYAQFGKESEIETQAKPVTLGIIPERFWAELGRDTKLNKSWLGKRDDIEDTTGSGQDMALVSALRRHGFREEEAKAILKNSPCGKKNYTDQYADCTIRKVYSQ